jgi:hypothetical protein
MYIDHNRKEHRTSAGVAPCFDLNRFEGKDQGRGAIGTGSVSFSTGKGVGC